MLGGRVTNWKRDSKQSVRQNKDIVRCSRRMNVFKESMYKGKGYLHVEHV